MPREGNEEARHFILSLWRRASDFTAVWLLRGPLSPFVVAVLNPSE